MKYSDRQRIQRIYDYAIRLQQYILEEHIEKEALLTQLPLQWLVTTPLYNMGEHCHNLSTEYKVKHREIPWTMIAGLRHRLVHDYDGTNWSIISEVIFEELPILIEQLRLCLRESENTDAV